MKNPDYLVMCSQCEVRIHPEDYKKHKKTCQQAPAYILYPVYPQPFYPYNYWNRSPWWEWQPTVSTGGVSSDYSNGTVISLTGSNS